MPSSQLGAEPEEKPQRIPEDEVMGRRTSRQQLGDGSTGRREGARAKSWGSRNRAKKRAGTHPGAGAQSARGSLRAGEGQGL